LQDGPGRLDTGVELVAGQEKARLVPQASETILDVDVARRDGVYPDGCTFEHFSVERTFDPSKTLTVVGLHIETVSIRGHPLTESHTSLRSTA